MFRISSILFGLLLFATFKVSGFARDPAARPVLTNLDGRVANPLGRSPSRLTVFVFVRTDCPIANRYAPEITRLEARFARRGVRFFLVYPDADESADAIRQHLQEYGYRIPALRDPHQLFARRSRVRVTPEAALYAAAGALLYHGRIDDRHADLGKSRPAAVRRDLKEALLLALAGKPVRRAGPPGVGCLIEKAP